jgi:hypothetical protein
MPDDDVAPDSLTRADRVARQILDDRAKPKPTARIAGCFACGRSYAPPLPGGDDSTRFCGSKCRMAYDAGAQPAREDSPFAIAGGPWRVIAGADPGYVPKTAMRQTRHGFTVACLHCKREFESSGLRCCSPTCERDLKESAQNVALIVEAGGELVEKRKCVVCAGAIPKYVGTGKKRQLTRKTKVTCSSKCYAKARKMGLSEASQPAVEGGTLGAPVSPLFGRSSAPANLTGGYRWPGVPDIDLSSPADGT